MSQLLLRLRGNPSLNRTIWPPHLFLYDDVMVYRKRTWFKVREITIAYSHLAQVNLVRGIFFASLELVNTGMQNILVKWLSKELATKAKKIIDQKIYVAHAKEKPKESEFEVTTIGVGNYEKSLNRLKELLNKGMISKHEYDSRRRKYLKLIK